jgi:hypothetical protein
MSPNNRDDLLRTITRLMDDLIREMEASDDNRIISYTILATVAGDKPAGIRFFPDDHPATPFEVVEGEEVLSITALLPPGSITEPSVTLQPLLVEISLGGETSVVDLPCRIDVRSCSFQVKNRVLDITCRKA